MHYPRVDWINITLHSILSRPLSKKLKCKTYRYINQVYRDQLNFNRDRGAEHLELHKANQDKLVIKHITHNKIKWESKMGVQFAVILYAASDCPLLYKTLG